MGNSFATAYHTLHRTPRMTKFQYMEIKFIVKSVLLTRLEKTGEEMADISF